MPDVTAAEISREAGEALAADPLAGHGCLHAAVVVTPGGERVWYPCRSDEGGKHHFAAHWPACPAPWCRLPYSHYLDGTMHEIPPGTAALVGPNEAVSRG